MSDLRKSSSKRKFSGTPMKMLIAQEMSKEVDSKQSPPNLVAKLMGLDSLPMQLPSSVSQRSRSNGNIQHNRSKSLTGVKKIEHSHHGRSYSEMQMLHGCTKYGDFTDIYDMWQQSQNENSIKENSPEKSKSVNEKRMALVRQKFSEAKLLASDEKSRESKQFQDAVEVLSSNRDLFLKFLQEPNSLISRHLHELQSFPPLPETKRITVLKPTKIIGDEQQTKKSSPVSGFSPPCDDEDAFASQPTRIVLLKPGNGKAPGNLHDDILFQKVEDGEIQESQANEISGILTTNWRDASAFSNGGDSPFKKSEIEYVDGNCSDFETTSPISRHSWEFLNRIESPCSSSSFSRASYSPESSVCKEAKKRLSQRWALIASKQASLEQQTHHRRSSSTLGEMLSLTDDKRSVTHEDQESPQSVPLNEIEEVQCDSPRRNFSRSKSAPSSTFHDESDSIEAPKEPTKKTDGLLWRLSSMFFSKGRKSKKENRDVSQKCGGTPDFTESIHVKVGSSISNHLVDRRMREDHDQPSLISVLDHSFEEDVQESFSNRKNMSCQSLRSNLIDKSPPIGSMSRTLSWNEAFLGSTSPCPSKPHSGPSFTEEEKQDLLDFIEKLLSKSGLSWHSPESPLDPSLRNKLSTLFDKEPPNETKRRQWRSNQNLVFDFVNAMIIEIARDRTISISGDHMWAQLKGWFFDDVCEEDENDRTRLVVERVVRDAVVGGGWRENLSLEIDNLGMEIEKQLVEEFLDDAVADLFVR